MSATILLAVVWLCAGTAAVASDTYCTPSEPCWPTEAEIIRLYDVLEPSLPRILKWEGGPRVSAVPLYSPQDQPLYGLGFAGLKPLYVRSDEDTKNTCFLPPEKPYASEFCLASTRNFPYEGWTPGFVAWPLTTAHVRELVAFAASHRLCVMVAGTGHDWVNRHSCPDGLFIRTSLMKQTTWDLTSTAHAPHGAVTFGAGIVFSEAHVSAAQNKRLMSSGWASTVGVIGWSVGCGHGPFAPALGMGCDNILAAELVLANGSVAVVNRTQYEDLLWALRGGGGSTWGVITSITLRAHPVPRYGVTRVNLNYHGCSTDAGQFESVVDNQFKLILDLDTRFGGIAWFSASRGTSQLANATFCLLGSWDIFVSIAFQGSDKDAGFKALVENLTAVAQPSSIDVMHYADWGQQILAQPLEPIAPVDLLILSPKSIPGLPSVLISREAVVSGRVQEHVKASVRNCFAGNGCTRHEFYHDITGHPDSPKDPFVSISPPHRTALAHVVLSGATTIEEVSALYALGNHSYFSESSYVMPGQSWHDRYWGTNFARLQQIKTLYDPGNVFRCHHCVAASAANTPPAPPLYSFWR